MTEAPKAMVAAVRVGWRAFEGFGRPWEGWFWTGREWRTSRRAFTRGGALAGAMDAAQVFVSSEASGKRIVARSVDATEKATARSAPARLVTFEEAALEGRVPLMPGDGEVKP